MSPHHSSAVILNQVILNFKNKIVQKLVLHQNILTDVLYNTQIFN